VHASTLALPALSFFRGSQFTDGGREGNAHGLKHLTAGSEALVLKGPECNCEREEIGELL